MTTEIRDFTVTIPAGTLQSAGFTAPLSFPARIVTQINVRVPPGPRGEVGFAIGTGGLNVLPYGQGTFIVTDNEDLEYQLTDTIQSGAWQLLAYNTGAYDHTLRIYFFCDVVTPAAGGSSAPIDTGTLTGTTSGTGDTGAGTGTGDGGTGTEPPPPVITPPTPPSPPTVTAPVLLPPSFPVPPLGTTPAPLPVPEVAMIGVESIAEVWLLEEDRYTQIVDQDTVNAMGDAGIIGVPVSQAQHDALIAASLPSITVSLGQRTYTGTYTLTHSGG